MESKNISKLHPITPVIFISSKDRKTIPTDAITIDTVGEKAFGLSCLPKAWTLPFVVVSSDMLSQYRDSSERKKSNLVKGWAKEVISAAHSVGIEDTDQIIVRSSGCSEGLNERGKFCSVQGILSKITLPIYECLHKLSNDIDLKEQQIPIVIQKYAEPVYLKGHLSNDGLPPWS